MSITSTLLEQQAEEKFENELWHEGLQLLEQAVLEDPHNIELLQKTIFVANELEESEIALRNLEYIEPLLESETDSNFLIHKSQALLNADRADEAVQFAHQVIELFESPEAVNHARSLRARANYTMKAFEEAIVDFELVLEINPDWYGGIQALGWSYLNVGRYEEAQQAFASYIDLDAEQYADFYYGLGVSYFEQQKYEEAVSAFTSAIRLEEQPLYYYFRGQSLYYLATVDYQKELALADFIETLDRMPDFHGAKIWLGDIQYELGNFEEAIELYEQMIEENPKWVSALTSLGWARYYHADSEEMYIEAKSAFTKALEIEEENISAQSGLAQTLYQLEAYEEAIQVIDGVLIEHPDWMRGYSLKGWCLYLGYETLEKYEEAIKVFDQSLQLDASDAFSFRGRAFAHMLLKEYEAARNDFEAADAEDNALNIAWCEGMLGHYDVAIHMYENLPEEERTGDYYHEFAYVLSEAGEEEQAMDMYEKAFEHDTRSCTYGNYASHLARGEGRPADPVEGLKRMEAAYEMQSQEERPCGCITGKLAHYYLKGIGGLVQEERALQLMQAGLEAGNDKESFTLMYAYCLATGTLFEQDIEKALALLENFLEQNRSAHAWYIYATLKQDDIIKEQALEQIEKYGRYEDKKILAKINERLTNGVWEFFYPMND